MAWLYQCKDYESCARELVGETKEELAQRLREHQWKDHGHEMAIAEADAAIKEGARHGGDLAA